MEMTASNWQFVTNSSCNNLETVLIYTEDIACILRVRIIAYLQQRCTHLFVLNVDFLFNDWTYTFSLWDPTLSFVKWLLPIQIQEEAQ